MPDSSPALPELSTPRLWLRAWRDSDLQPFAELNADAQVMEHFPRVLSTPESNALAERIRTHFQRRGFGLWATELRDTGEFVGFVGLSIPNFEAHFTPCVEVGWRLARAHWGRGYATEGARAALAYAFDVLHLDEVVSMTVPANERSRHVMEKLGMRRDVKDDFDHPNLPVGHALRRHVLYRLSRPEAGS